MIILGFTTSIAEPSAPSGVRCTETGEWQEFITGYRSRMTGIWLDLPADSRAIHIEPGPTRAEPLPTTRRIADCEPGTSCCTLELTVFGLGCPRNCEGILETIFRPESVERLINTRRPSTPCEYCASTSCTRRTYETQDLAIWTCDRCGQHYARKLETERARCTDQPW